jgi:hypothetical protein
LYENTGEYGLGPPTEDEVDDPRLETLYESFEPVGGFRVETCMRMPHSLVLLVNLASSILTDEGKTCSREPCNAMICSDTLTTMRMNACASEESLACAGIIDLAEDPEDEAGVML